MAAGESNDDESYRDGRSDGLSESSDNPVDGVAKDGSRTAAVVPVPNAIVLV